MHTHTHTHVLTCCLIYKQQTPHPPHFAFSSPPSCGACSISAQTDSFKLQSMCCISDRLLAQPPAERHLVSSFHKQYCGDYFTVLIYFWLPWVRGLCLSVLCLRRVGRPLAAVCASHGGGSSHCTARAPGCAGSVVSAVAAVGSSTRARWVCSMGLAAPLLVGPSRTQDPAHVPGVGRWILICYAAREVRQCWFLFPDAHVPALSAWQLLRAGQPDQTARGFKMSTYVVLFVCAQ